MADGFKELRVWQKSKDLAVTIYQFSKTTGLKNDYGLRDQLCRCAVSVPSNIAEGDERDSNKDCIRFLYIAKGSLAELRTQTQIACEIGYLSKDQFEAIDVEAVEIRKMLGALIKARSQ